MTQLHKRLPDDQVRVLEGAADSLRGLTNVSIEWTDDDEDGTAAGLIDLNLN